MLNLLSDLDRKVWKVKLTVDKKVIINVKNPNYLYQHKWGHNAGTHYYTFIVCNLPLPPEAIAETDSHKYTLPTLNGDSSLANSVLQDLLSKYGFVYHYQMFSIVVDHFGSTDPLDALILSCNKAEGNVPQAVKKTHGYQYVPYGYQPVPTQPVPTLSEMIMDGIETKYGNKKKAQPIEEFTGPKTPSNRMKGLLTLIAEKIDYAGMVAGAHLNENWATNIQKVDMPEKKQFVFDRIKQLKYSQSFHDQHTGQPLDEGKFNHVIEVYWKEPMLNSNDEMIKAILYHPQYQSTYEKVCGIELVPRPYWRPLYNYKKDEIVEALKVMCEQFELEFKDSES